MEKKYGGNVRTIMSGRPQLIKEVEQGHENVPPVRDGREFSEFRKIF